MEHEIVFNEKKVLVKLKDRLGWKESNDCVRLANKYINGKPQLDMVTQFELMLQKSIISIEDIETKEKINVIEFLDKVDKPNGDFLFNKVQESNSINETDKKNLEHPSLEKN
jgi:hypothetical protein